MSVHVTSYILRYSEARLGDRLVLLALGDHAHHDGTHAYAAVEKLALEARLSERQTRRCLRNLEADGHIEPTGVAEHGQIIYRVVMGGQNDPPANTTGGTKATESRSDMSPEPSKEPSSRTSDEVLRVAEALETHVKEVTGKGKKLTQADLKTIDRMGRLDGVNLDEVVRFLNWLTASSSEVAQFWAPNILSATKLREQFPRVRAQAARERASANRRRDGMTDEQHQAAVLEGARRVDEAGRT